MSIVNTSFSFDTGYDDVVSENTLLGYSLKFDSRRRIMDYNYTLRIDGEKPLYNFQNISKSDHVDIRIQAMSYMMYKIGK